MFMASFFGVMAGAYPIVLNNFYKIRRIHYGRKSLAAYYFLREEEPTLFEEIFI
jgi:hypothetical protein